MEEKAEEKEVNEIAESEVELTSNISNLASAFSCLMEVDGALLSKQRQSKLARMKRQIFDALDYYCSCLPEIEKDDAEKTDKETE